ncbi:hypothetical protein [Candidatus Chlamydia sanziniae]|nr:hypothetical protein [Candidatus Chlamydia sanziniae]
MLWCAPNQVANFYKISLTAEECVGSIQDFPQAEELSEGACALKFPEFEEKLPDLRQEVIFLGSNDRPDALGGKFTLELVSSGDRYIAAPEEKVYLQMETSACGPRYFFSPAGISTELWLECRSLGLEGKIEVKVRLMGMHHAMISSPREREILFLNTRTKIMDFWEIGGVKVDASFPIKQKIRRLGFDKFLLMHGGTEYADKATKERVDFVSITGENYSRYLAIGDILLWDGSFWQTCGEFQGESSQVPLLEVKKIDDKIMLIDLWNVEGTMHQSVSLVKTLPSPMEVTEVMREIEFIGMRSWSRPIVLMGEQRMILSPDDWILRTETGWEKIMTVQQIQDYLSGMVSGPLFVFDKLEKDLSGFVLRGHMFNVQRTLVETILLPLKQGFEADIATMHQEASSPSPRAGGTGALGMGNHGGS